MTVGTTIDRVLDDPVDGRMARPAPKHISVAMSGRQLQSLLDEPEQRLEGAADPLVQAHAGLPEQRIGLAPQRLDHWPRLSRAPVLLAAEVTVV